MKRKPTATIEPKVKRGPRWTRVYVEADERDVSHLLYGPRHLRMGQEGVVRMAAIGGVGTDSAFRRRGLGGRVLARAVEEMRRDGYPSVGLYTSRRIVAHRLYRRFGFVDVARRVPRHKLLDPARFLCDALSEMIQKSAEVRRRRPVIRLTVAPYGAVAVRLEEDDVHRFSRTPRRVDLSLEMSAETFTGLWSGDVSFHYTETAKLVRWTGDAELHRLLAEALAPWHRPVQEE